MKVVKASSLQFDDEDTVWLVLVNDTNYAGLHIKNSAYVYGLDGSLIYDRSSTSRHDKLFGRQAKEKALLIKRCDLESPIEFQEDLD
jgi:hypothetical protein